MASCGDEIGMPTASLRCISKAGCGMNAYGSTAAMHVLVGELVTAIRVRLPRSRAYNIRCLHIPLHFCSEHPLCKAIPVIDVTKTGWKDSWSQVDGDRFKVASYGRGSCHWCWNGQQEIPRSVHSFMTGHPTSYSELTPSHRLRVRACHGYHRSTHPKWRAVRRQLRRLVN